MSGIFSICQDRGPLENSLNSEPLKFKFLKAISLFNPILRSFVLPNKKEKYKFSREHLSFIKSADSHIPVVHLAANNPQKSIVLVYSHGSGSTLNNIFGFGVNMMARYGIGVVLYDYNGEGESDGSFQSYESDIKTVLAWVLKLGYNPRRTILAGFSIGSYPTLQVPGPSPRLLISALCGLIPLIEGTAHQYEGQIFDNIGNAQKIKARSMVIHCKEEFVPISHAHAIVEALSIHNDVDTIRFLGIDGYNHQSAPSFLCSQEASRLVKDFLRKVMAESKEALVGVDREWEAYQKNLKEIGQLLKIERQDSTCSSNLK